MKEPQPDEEVRVRVDWGQTEAGRLEGSCDDFYLSTDYDDCRRLVGFIYSGRIAKCDKNGNDPPRKEEY